jgi:hypothetical protein
LLATRPPEPGGADAPLTEPVGCVDLPYRPCGEVSAPGTDGRRCVDDRADYDGGAANGCEALPDDLDGTALGEVDATIVPAGDTDEFDVEVADNFHFSCDGRVTFELTAPRGLSLRLDVVDPSGEVLGEATSADGVTARLQLREPQCAGDDRTTLVARVSPIGSDRVADPYHLARSGSW